MLFNFVTGFVVINFVFVWTARVSALRLVLRRTYGLEVVPLATSTAGLAIRWTHCFSTLAGVFRNFLLDLRCSWILLHDFQTSDDLYPAERDSSSRQLLSFAFLSPFSLRCLWLSPFEDILWRVCLYSIVATWGFRGSIALSASKSCGSVNWGSQSQFLWTAAQPDLYFDFSRSIIFFSTKLSGLNMVPTQRTYGNILRIPKTNAFVWGRLILKEELFEISLCRCSLMTLNI